VEIENPRYPDLRGIGGKFLLPLIGSEEQFLSLIKQIGDSRPLRPFYHIVLLTPTPIKEGLLSFYAHFANEAEIGTTFAFK
jgi:hypothetical protein